MKYHRLFNRTTGTYITC